MTYQKIPLSSEDENVFLEAYVADRIGTYRRKAILVIPGGAYGNVCSDREGEPVAMAFMPYGYQAFVLHYSVGCRRPFPAPLIEASLAIKHIKDNAEAYGIDPEEVFAVGFSAGGHLTACLGTLWKHPAVYEAIDMPYGYNKPKGMMLIYPVITPAFRHKVSFYNLLCNFEPTAEQLEEVSLDKYVDADTAPAFIVHTSNDQEVDVKNSLVYATALSDAGHKYELHIYPDAPHGIALGNEITACTQPGWRNDAIAEWVRQAAYWADHL